MRSLSFNQVDEGKDIMKIRALYLYTIWVLVGLFSALLFKLQIIGDRNFVRILVCLIGLNLIISFYLDSLSRKRKNEFVKERMNR